MKKIAFIVELAGTARHGGEQHAMLQVAEVLKKQGYKVDVFSYTSPDPKLRIKTLVPFKLRLIPFFRELFLLPFMGISILRNVDKMGYQVVHTSSTTLASLYKPKAKLVITCHIIRTQKFEVFRKIKEYRLIFNNLFFKLIKTWEKKTFDNANKIIVVKDHLKAYLTDNFDIPETKIEIVPNAIDTDLFRPLKIKKKSQVIFVGRGTEPKGLDVILEAADKIKGSILVVTKKIDAKLQNIAKDKSNVTIRYNVSPRELAVEYSESKVFVLPSLDDERQTLSVMEAMACGLPIVATEQAAGDIVETPLNGYIIPPKNSEVLTRFVNKLLENNSKKFLTRNRQKILNNNSLTKVAKLIEKNYS